MEINIGQVYKVHSDSYYVKVAEEIVICRARGNLKKTGDGISVGDIVGIKNNIIEKIFPRSTHFIRPNVSNVDAVMVLISPQPKPDLYLLDKLYINSVKEDTEFIIAVNKSDIDKGLYSKIYDEYVHLGVKVVNISALDGSGIDKLKNLLRGKLTVLAGQSAAGKTTLINKLFNKNLKTGELSDKILRGKHTTTRSEIFETDDIRVIDSPGFAVIDADVKPEELPMYYPEYFEVSSECKYRGCTHINEPGCKVKQLVNEGKLSKERYERYKNIYNDIKDRRDYEKN